MQHIQVVTSLFALTFCSMSSALFAAPPVWEQLSPRKSVAADSRFSELRRKAGIGADMRDFGRVCIVARVRHDLPHDETAYEWFDVDQTLALLPLNGRQSSVVLTLPADRANAVMTSSP